MFFYKSYYTQQQMCTHVITMLITQDKAYFSKHHFSSKITNRTVCMCFLKKLLVKLPNKTNKYWQPKKLPSSLPLYIILISQNQSKCPQHELFISCLQHGQTNN